MNDVEREQRTDRIMNTVVIIAVVVAVIVGVLLVLFRSDGGEPIDPAYARQVQADLDAAERAKRRERAHEAARERRAMLDGEDRANEKRVLWDWQDDTWMSDEVWRVKVHRGRVTIDSKLDPVKGAEFTARALCEGTLERYDWAKSVRVRYRPPSSATAARC